MIMKLIKRKALIPVFLLFLTVLTCISIFGNPLTSSAAGTADIFIDSNSWIPVGDTFTMIVRVETDRDSLVHLEISYNGNNLECLGISPSSECTDDGSTIKIVSLSFKTTHKYECVFKVKNEAATTVKASVIECGSLEGELPTPSIQKTINGYVPTPTPTQAPTPTVTPTSTSNATQSATQTPIQTQKPTQTPSYTPFNPTANPSATPANPDEFLDNGELRYVADDFEENEVTIPEGFEKRAVKYNDRNIFGAQNASGVNLVYATDVLGQNGKFYIYIEKQIPLFPYLEIPYGNNSYVFTKFDEIPTSLREIDFELAENKITAYTPLNNTYKDFIVLYGFKVGGELSYYLYDTAEGTLQRCVDPSILNSFHESWDDDNNGNETPPMQTPAESTSKPTTAPLNKNDNFNIDKKTIIFAIIIICAIAVIIAIITIIVRSKKIANNFKNDDDDEYYDEEEFMSAQSAPALETEETDPDTEQEPTTPEQELPELEDDEDEILQLGND